MQLKYGNKHFEIENNIVAINSILEEINKLIQQKDKIFSHLIIDGVEVYENHGEYIKENLNKISKIEVATRNNKEMMWETMESIHSYLQGAIPALKKLIDESYEQFSSKSWEGINQLAEGMQWIIQFTAVVEAAPKKPGNWKGIKNSLQTCNSNFEQLLEAIEMKDTILITDILSYEITPGYESLQKEIELSLRDKEFLKDVN